MFVFLVFYPAPLSNIVYSIGITPTISKLQKYALISVRLMSKIAAKNHGSKFADLLKNLSKLIRPGVNLTIESLVFVVQCLGELIANLRLNSIAHMHLFMPATINVLEKLLYGQIDVGFHITLTAISKIVANLPLFLSSHLQSLIACLSISWSRLQGASPNYSHGNMLLILDKIWTKLSTSFELRVLIPEVERIYPILFKRCEFDATGPMMVLLSKSFQHSAPADLVQNCHNLTAFFIGVMDFRSKFHDECETVDVQEDFFIKTLVEFILKLSEASFRPFYHKLLEWSKENAEQSYDRAITLYR